MYACIFAGGKGVRMRPLTETLPKPLIPILGRSILEYTLSALPPAITHVVLVTGYLAEAVREKFGDSYAGKMLFYVIQDEPRGTAYALFQAIRALPRGEPFVVLNGDDLYYPDDLMHLISHPLAIGVKPILHPAARYLHVAASPKGFMIDLRKPQPDETTVNVATGAYILDHRIFGYEPVRIGSGELGLPHTVARMAHDVPVFVEAMDHWFPLTSPDDLASAEEHLRRHPIP